MNFNSRTSQEVRHCIQFILLATFNFNSRTSQEVRLDGEYLNGIVDKFQLTYLTRGTTDQEVERIRYEKISTHVPHKRYDIRQLNAVHTLEFQLTYLTRGTTLMILKMLIQMNNFNSRTSQEVRRTQSEQLTGFIHFNSRTSQEVRLKHRLVISIVNQFQLTYLTRGTTFSDFLRFAVPKFQLTYLTRGTTMLAALIASSLSYFNSRTSQEVRLHQLVHRELFLISTHVPHKRYDGL